MNQDFNRGSKNDNQFSPHNKQHQYTNYGNQSQRWQRDPQDSRNFNVNENENENENQNYGHRNSGNNNQFSRANYSNQNNNAQAINHNYSGFQSHSQNDSNHSRNQPKQHRARQRNRSNYNPNYNRNNDQSNQSHFRELKPIYSASKLKLWKIKIPIRLMKQYRTDDINKEQNDIAVDTGVVRIQDNSKTIIYDPESRRHEMNGVQKKWSSIVKRNNYVPMKSNVKISIVNIEIQNFEKL